LASGSSGKAFVAGSGLGLGRALELSVEAGHVDREEGLASSYRYGLLSLSGDVRFVDWYLSYSWTSRDAREIFPASTVDDRFVLTLSVALL